MEGERSRAEETKGNGVYTTEMPSTETSIDRSIMSSAKRAMQRACCWHSSGSPLTAMYLSPTVSTCHDRKVGRTVRRRVLRESERGALHGSRAYRVIACLDAFECPMRYARTRRDGQTAVTIRSGITRRGRSPEHFVKCATSASIIAIMPGQRLASVIVFGFSIQPVTSLTTPER